MYDPDVPSGALTAVIADEWCLVREGVRSLARSVGVVSRVLASTVTEALAELRPGELLVLGSCPDTSAEIAVRRARTGDGVRIVVLASRRVCAERRTGGATGAAERTGGCGAGAARHRALERGIAVALHIGAETVKTHLSNLYLKLGVTSRDQAVAAALRSGLL